MKHPLNIITVVLLLSLGLFAVGCSNEPDPIVGPVGTTLLGGGGGAADTTPPTVLSTSPTNGAIDVTTWTTIQATFSEAVTNVSADVTFILQDAVLGSHVTGSIYAVSPNVMLFVPHSELTGSTLYRVTLTGIRDRFGNTLASNYQWTFTTSAAADTTAPSVIFSTPTATNASINSPIQAYFSELLNAATVNATSFQVNGGAVTGTVSYVGGPATFTPTTMPLISNQSYTVTLTGAIQDLAPLPNGLTPFTWSFKTAAAPVIATASLPVTTATGTYSTTLAMVAGGRPVVWTLTSGSLPGSIVLNATSGLVSGATVTADAGVYPVTVTATDDDGLVSNATLTLTVNAVPVITAPPLPAATVGFAYGPVSLTMTGGTGTMTWAKTGTLPTGMTFNTSTGTLSGTPTTNAGSPYSLTFTVRDAAGVTSAAVPLTLTVN